MKIIDQLQQQFPHLEFRSDYQLKNQTYFKIGGKAEVYLEMTDKNIISRIISFCHQKNIKFTVLGGASNVIIEDQGISGLVIKLKNNSFHVTSKKVKANKYLIEVGAGLKTALLVKKTTDQGYQGLELFLGIPGTVGGAVFNNAHYLSHLISDHIHQVEVVDQKGEVKILNCDECQFAYDSSRFQKSKEIILEVVFALKKGLSTASQKLIKEATQYRARTQPIGLPSSGCIFKNTPSTPQLQKLFPDFKDKKFISAGFLIDQAGLKGLKIGGIEVSTKHAAFFINHGSGSSEDLKKLIALVKKEIKKKFGLVLEEEVFYLS